MYFWIDLQFRSYLFTDVCYGNLKNKNKNILCKHFSSANTLNLLSKEEVAIDGKRQVDPHHRQSCKVQDDGHLLGSLHHRFQRDDLQQSEITMSAPSHLMNQP